jgi:quercetin dioxygenase-like cupin family protein
VSIGLLRNLLALAAMLGVSMTHSPASAQSESQIAITRSGSQPATSASPDHFTGSARVEMRFQATAPGRVNGSYVTFEPGAHTDWHSHPLGQTLIVTAGTGRVQQWGHPVQTIAPGDIIWIPPGVKHWHGAAATTGMTHIAISEALHGKTVDWMEKVSDEHDNTR